MPIDETERARRHALLDAHYEAENEHDLERIMATFSPSTEFGISTWTTVKKLCRCL